MKLEPYQKIYIYKRLVQAKLFIESNYAECIDMDNIADEANFSKYHFMRLFKRVYGKTPYHYLTQVRIDHAKRLLGEQLSVASTSFAVGFNSSTSFTTLFRRNVGVTPSEFRHRQMLRKTDIAVTPLRYIPGCFADYAGWTENSKIEEVLN